MNRLNLENEMNLVKRFYELIKGNREEISSLNRVCKGNKAVSQLIREMGKSWGREELWGEKEVPDVKPDLIFVFGNILKKEEVLIVATEVKYFRKNNEGKLPAFYEGLQQAMAYAVFGFDGISLWQLFSEELSDKVIRFYVEETKEIVKSFKLPIFYLGLKLLAENKLKCFAPYDFSDSQEIDYFVRYLASYFTQNQNKNPLLEEKRIKERRESLRVTLAGLCKLCGEKAKCPFS